VIYEGYTVSRDLQNRTSLPDVGPFLEHCLSLTYLYVLMNNYQRHNSCVNPVLTHNPSVSKIKTVIQSIPYPDDIIAVIREAARPMRFAGNIYYPDPNFTAFNIFSQQLNVVEGTPLCVFNNVYGPVGPEQLLLPNLRFRPLVAFQLNASLQNDYAKSFLTLEGLESSELFVCDDTNYWTRELNETRTKACITLKTCNITGDLNLTWIAENYMRTPVMANSRHIPQMINLPVKMDDLNNAYVFEVKTSVAIKVMNLHFPSLGAKVAVVPRSFGTSGASAKRSKRKPNKKVENKSEGKPTEKKD